MDIQRYKRRLTDLEAQLSGRAARLEETAREQVLDSPGDAADASAADEAESESLGEADLDLTVLQQVRDALHRIEDGTFGRCVVDGRTIDEKRLEAVPWTPYCAEHERLREAGSERRTTL